MKRPTVEQQRAIVAQWKLAAPALARQRAEELSSSRYDWRKVDALLSVGCQSKRDLQASGMVEMQRLFRLKEDAREVPHSPDRAR